MEALICLIKGTAFWIYPIFAYLVFIGIEALKRRTVFLGKLLIVPFTALFLNLYRLIAKFQSWRDLPLWIFFLAIGGLVGFALLEKTKVRANRKKLLLRLEGSYFILIVVVALFLLQTVFGCFYLMSRDPGAVSFGLGLMFSSFLTGLFFGRSYHLAHKFSKARHESQIKDPNKKKGPSKKRP